MEKNRCASLDMNKKLSIKVIRSSNTLDLSYRLEGHLDVKEK